MKNIDVCVFLNLSYSALEVADHVDLLLNGLLLLVYVLLFIHDHFCNLVLELILVRV